MPDDLNPSNVAITLFASSMILSVLPLILNVADLPSIARKSLSVSIWLGHIILVPAIGPNVIADPDIVAFPEKLLHPEIPLEPPSLLNVMKTSLPPSGINTLDPLSVLINHFVSNKLVLDFELTFDFSVPDEHPEEKVEIAVTATKAIAISKLAKTFALLIL